MKKSLTQDRLPCQTKGCENTIQPATAKRNDGYCGSCFNRIAQAKRKAYIEANRKEIDLYLGVSDPVEMLTILHEPRKYDPLIRYLPCPSLAEDLYAMLSSEQAVRLMDFAALDFETGGNRTGEDIARCLAAFTGHDLSPLLLRMIEAGRCYPPIAFRGASEEVASVLMRDLLVGKLGTNHALLCLAWIGSESVVAFFDEADRDPPAWAEHLYVKPGRYAHEAGWEVRDGRRHDLYYTDCFAIEVLPEGEAGERSVETMQDRTDVCAWCSRRLLDMLRLDSIDPRLDFLPKFDAMLRIPTCQVCTCFTDGGPFMKHSAEGDWAWATANQRPDCLPPADQEWGTSLWAEASLGLKPRPPHFAADDFLPTTCSQIGGLPTWVQDSQYPSCCDCGRTMTFLAQLDNGDAGSGEGVYYAFICPACQVTATAYQQT